MVTAHADCPSYDPTNSIKALTKVQSIDHDHGFQPLASHFLDQLNDHKKETSTAPLQ